MKKVAFFMAIAMIALGAVSCRFVDPIDLNVTTGSGGTIYDAAGGGVAYNDYPLTVTEYGTVYSFVSVNIRGLHHTYASDLTFSLVAPDGTAYLLKSPAGSSADFYGDYSFSTTGTEFYTISGGIITPGAYLNDSLGMDGITAESINGVWKLRITDSASSDTGSFTSWELNIKYY